MSCLLKKGRSGPISKQCYIRLIRGTGMGGQCELRPEPGGPARPQSPHRRSGNSPCHSAIDHDLACEAGSTQVLVLHPSMSSVRCLQGWCMALHANIKPCFHMQAGRPQPLATVFSLDPCPLYVIGCWIVRAPFHSLLIC
jgi:hypothetical protein